MKLILCEFFRHYEWKNLMTNFPKQKLITAAHKAAQGLSIPIKGSQIPGTRLLKIYLTSKAGAGRLIFLLKLRNQDLYRLFCDSKLTLSEKI